MLYGLRAKVRYVLGLLTYLRHDIGYEEAHAHVIRSLARREENFLRLAEMGIYGKPDSPFRRLLLSAGVELEDLKRRLAEKGLEATLQELYDLGVYLTYDEMRGRTPVSRNGLEFTIEISSLDNPLLEAQYEMTSTGSSGNAGSRSFTDLNLLAHESAHYAVHYKAQDVESNPVAFWGPPPPSLLGLTGVLRFAKMGRMPRRWFTPVRFPSGWAGVKTKSLVLFTMFVSALAGKRFPWPQYVPADQQLVVAKWLAAMKRQGRPALLQITASGATRVCLAANENGLDISGTVFRAGGEPYTEAKAAVVASAGARAFTGYAATELGNAGLGCADPDAAIDDLHLMTDKFFTFTRDKQVDEAGSTVPALVYTTLHPNCRKIMLNAECGDYGTLEDRDCGCLIGALGYRTHLTGLHGYDKMTSEGVTFMGSDLFRLVEDVLPARFGGSPTDYQLAEEEGLNGIPRVSIVVSPGVGEIDEEALLATVVQTLSRFDGPDRGPAMATRWLEAGVLQIVRREPFAAGGRKVLPLHLMPAPKVAAGPEKPEP